MRHAESKGAKDYVSRERLADALTNAEEHIDFLETQLNLADS